MKWNLTVGPTFELDLLLTHCWPWLFDWAAGKPDTEKKPESRKGPQIRPNRMKVAQPIPTEEDLAAIKHKKKVRILAGSLC